MHDQIPPPGGEIMLLFKDIHPIHSVQFDEVPFFSLADISMALGWNYRADLYAKADDFPDHGRRIVRPIDRPESPGAIYLSPVGVWRLTALLDPYGGQALAAWAKRETTRLIPEPRTGDPAVFLTLDEDGDLPPAPTKYSGRRAEWLALKEARLQAQMDGAKAVWAERREAQKRMLEEASTQFTEKLDK